MAELNEKKVNKELAEEIMFFSGASPRQCMKCGKCSATCPAFDEMDLHPHEFISYIVDGRVDKLMASKTLYYCLSCFACVERCPRSVEPARVVEAIRDYVAGEKGGDYLSPDDIPERLDEDLPQQAITAAFRKYKK